jgi:mono/diheme cytochrome c family protein
MRFVLGALALVVIAACGTEENTVVAPEKTSPMETGMLAFADIEPILDARCVGCHGIEEPKDGVNLTDYASVMVGGEHGPIVVAGKPDESELVEVISAGHEPRMPFKQDPLTDEEIAKISDWVAQGAKE